LAQTSGILHVPQNANKGEAGKSILEQFDALNVSSGAYTDRPVTLPPGWARLWTKPSATASALAAITIGILVVASLAALTESPPRHDDVYTERD